MPKLDDAYREQLTEQEIAAFEAETEDDATEALEALANPEEDTDPDPAPDADDNDTSPTDEGGEDPDPDPEPTPDPDPEPQPEPTPEPVPDVAAAKQAVEDAKAKRKELRDAYNDGDLTDEEYDAQIEQVEDQIAEAAADVKTAERAIAKQQDAWKAAGVAYLDRYPGLKADGVIQALDKAVQELAQYPSVANLPHDQFLERVHRKLIAEAEYTGLDIPAITTGKSKAEKRTAPEGDEALGKPPRTLANAPASDVSGLDDSPFASLQRLAENGNPVDFEAAMAKLPADKRDEFASMMID